MKELGAIGALMAPYIVEQAELFSAVFHDKERLTAEFVSLFEKSCPKELVLIASGTSYHGAATAAPFMDAVLGMKVTPFAPSRALRQKMPPDAMAVIVTQGGNSTNTVASIRQLEESSPTIVITANMQGMAAKVCKNVMLLPCGPEKAGPKTKGYLITVLLLYLCALQTARKLGLKPQRWLDEVEEQLTDAGAAMAENIKISEKWVRNNAVLLSKPQSYFFVSLGQGLAVAAEGALKTMETLLIPSCPYEFEEFLHGPFCSIQQTVGGVYLLPEKDDPDLERMQRLVDFHRLTSPSAFAIGAERSTDDRDCALIMTGQWYTRPFETVFPMQWASAIVPGQMKADGTGTGRFADLDRILRIKFPGEENG